MLEAQVEDRRRENLDELLRLAGIAGRWRDLVNHLGSTLPELGPSDRADVCVHIVDLIHFSVSDAYAQVRARIAGPQLERARSAQRELLRAV